MINCPNCGGLNGYGNPNCSFCGASLINNPVEQNTNTMPQPEVFVEQVYDNQDMGEFAQEPIYDPNINPEVTGLDLNNVDDVLVNAYIKKNVDKIKTSGFSIWAFLFGWIYVWYRKMHKLLLIWFGMNIVVSALVGLLVQPTIAAAGSFLVSLAFNIFVAIKFKDLYLKNVNNKVAIIKSKNANLSQEQLMAICSKKGGTTVLPIIVLVILSVGLPVLAFLLYSSIWGENTDEQKKEAMVLEAGTLIEVARSDILVNEVKDNVKVYTMEELNDMLETKLLSSPFGNSYSDAKVQAIKTMDGSYVYKVCLIDEGKNGFGYTSEITLSSESVLIGTAPDAC